MFDLLDSLIQPTLIKNPLYIEALGSGPWRGSRKDLETYFVPKIFIVSGINKL